MIVLDTNVLSELMRVQPETSVVNWMDEQDSKSVFLTAITAAEILYGITRLPNGKRKRELDDTARALFSDEFRGRILPFNAQAAPAYADLICAREQIGHPINMADAQIAAICVHYDAILATRNIKDFRHSGVELFNPWSLTST